MINWIINLNHIGMILVNTFYNLNGFCTGVQHGKNEKKNNILQVLWKKKYPIKVNCMHVGMIYDGYTEVSSIILMLYLLLFKSDYNLKNIYLFESE
jgi:hypothetical protein